MKTSRHTFWFVGIGLLCVFCAASYWLVYPQNLLAPESLPSPSSTIIPFNKERFSLTDPASIWIVANKIRPLPAGYVPADLEAPNVPLHTGRGDSEMHLRTEAARAVEELFTGAKQQDFELMVFSAYRSEDMQRLIYSAFSAVGKNPDDYSARPGYSEHQTGLSLDIERADHYCALEGCLDTTEEGKWLQAHAHEYGFIMRYPLGKRAITGYEYEPWHFRYVGIDLATELFEKNQTIEEFFGLSAAPDYLPTNTPGSSQ